VQTVVADVPYYHRCHVALLLYSLRLRVHLSAYLLHVGRGSLSM